MKSVIIISIAFVLLFVPLSAFAQTDNITSKHWFISSYEDGCSVDNQKSLEFYEKLTPQYLSKYDIHGSQDAGKCVRGIDVANNIEDFSSALENYDLPIIILDGFKGLDYLLTTDAFGHYVFQDNQAVIIFASLSPFVESDSGAWILSHELSHFALHHKQYSQYIVIDWVHQIQTEASSCVKNDLSLNNCPDLWMTVKSPLGKNIKMMAIYDNTSEDISQPTQPALAQPFPDFSCFDSYVQKNYNDAIQCYGNYLNSNPTDTSAMAFFGRSYEGVNQNNDALNIFQKINRLEPNNTNGLNGIARNYKSLEQCEKAVPYYEKTLIIEPNDIEAKTYINLLSLVCPNYSLISEPSTAKPSTPEPSKLELPQWIRNNAKWYAEGGIGESDFISGIQYMIKNGIMKIPNLPEQSTNESVYKVPDWIKNNAKWWSEGKISDDEFVKGLHFLVDKGIIILN